MYRKNADGSISWFNIDDHYRWGQGFVEEDLDCNLPWEGDAQAHARTDCGWGAELDDQHACWFEFSEDIPEEEKEAIETAYHEGGAGWLFDGEHDWLPEDDYLVIDAPYQVSLCSDDGTVIVPEVKLRERPKTNSSTGTWPFGS
jgi:hypothetical protein